MLDWDDLQTFLALARHGSLSAAARAMGVQQTTMGRRLAGLEARTGARLLQKTPSGLVPTPVGEAILGNAERIEAEALAAERTITGRDIRLEGTVRITTIEILAVDILMPVLAELRLRHPGIALELSIAARNLSLSHHEADIAVRMARLTQLDLAVRKVATLGSGLYASAAYLQRHGPPDLDAGSPGHMVILMQDDMMGMPEMVWLAQKSGRAAVALRTNSRYAQLAACQAGMGIAWLERFLGDRGGLVRFDAAPPPREVWMAVHTTIRHTPRIRAVTDALATGLRAAALRLDPETQ